MVDKQIVALGGGGFSTEPDNPALDLYVLEQAAAANPAVCFVGTATGDADRYIVNFYKAFTRYDCRPSHLSFFDRTPDLRETLLQKDVIYVGGGNTKSLLGVWREWRLPEILREAWDSGIVLAGISAGAVCWFEQGVSDSYAGSLTLLDCLGFLKGSCCPHYDGEAERRPAVHAFLEKGQLSAGYAIDDSAAIHFRGDKVYNAAASKPGAGAYRVGYSQGKVEEEPFDIVQLNQS